MEGDLSTSPARQIIDPAASAILLDPARRRFLEPFMRAELSTAQAARELGVQVKDMAYRVQRFVALGLLDRTREQPRHGRAIRYYRAPGRFFVPFTVLPEADLVEMVEALLLPEQHRAVRGLVGAMQDADADLHTWGWLLASEERVVSVGPAPGPDAGHEVYERLLFGDAAPMYVGWMPLSLSRERARELQRALVELVLRYRDDRGPHAYRMGLMLAPVEEDEARGDG